MYIVEGMDRYVREDEDPVVIFDLDGTLALIDERRAISTKQNGKIHYRKFFDPKNIKLDKPNLRVIEMLNLLKPSYRIVIFSGRSDRTKDATEHWLCDHAIHHDELWMRCDGDYTPDDILKQNWLREILLQKVWTHRDVVDTRIRTQSAEIHCVFDDRQRVVDMWRRNGITCFQVADGNF